MLSDEEKKAIEWLKIVSIIATNSFTMKEQSYLNIILNLIEKQKEKNKNLEDELNKYIVKMSDEEYRRLVDIIRDETSKEWKDKIKAKIEELDNTKSDKKYTMLFNSDNVMDVVKAVLQSLLEKE